MKAPDRPEQLFFSCDYLDLPSTTEDIVQQLRIILSKPYVREVHLDGNEGTIKVVWFRTIEDQLVVDPEESVDSILARVPIVEAECGSSGGKFMLETLVGVSAGGGYPAFLLAQDIGFLKEVMNIPSILPVHRVVGTDHYNFGGIRVIEAPSLPKESIILLVSDVAQASRFEVKSAIRLIF